MPTIIALDVSLSMTRAVPATSNEENLTYHQLAVQGIHQLLNYMTTTPKLEYISLVSTENRAFHFSFFPSSRNKSYSFDVYQTPIPFRAQRWSCVAANCLTLQKKKKQNINLRQLVALLRLQLFALILVLFLVNKANARANISFRYRTYVRAVLL